MYGVDTPDLFGEWVVTVPECMAWVKAVAPRWAGSSEHMARYIVAWNVPEKIKQAKAAGHFRAWVEGDL